MTEVAPGPRHSSTANPTTDVDAAYQTVIARSARPFSEGFGPWVRVAR